MKRFHKLTLQLYYYTRLPVRTQPKSFKRNQKLGGLINHGDQTYFCDHRSDRQWENHG